MLRSVRSPTRVPRRFSGARDELERCGVGGPTREAREIRVGRRRNLRNRSRLLLRAGCESRIPKARPMCHFGGVRDTPERCRGKVDLDLDLDPESERALVRGRSDDHHRLMHADQRCYRSIIASTALLSISAIDFRPIRRSVRTRSSRNSSSTCDTPVSPATAKPYR